MESSAITTLFLPLALGIIMLGLGLSLTIDDFRRVAQYPKAVIVGLACQVLILPFLCLGLASVFNLSPELAVGLMLLAASPGGPTANLFSHLANGDVALNISLTAVNSLLSLLTLPLIVNLSIAFFMEVDMAVPMQFKKILEVFFIVLIPVSIGMFIHAKSPQITQKLTKPVKILSALFLVLIIAAAIMKERANVVLYFQQVGLPALLFNLLSMLVGYQVPRLMQIGKRQSIAIGMEIGIHNGTLAIYIALSVLGNSVMSIPPAIYSLIMFFTAAIFGYWVNRDKQVA
jgi:BASS family bile acid:Na+ symporter